MEHLPDCVETEIREPGYFTFLLPVTAFGYRDDMMMEISVEYTRAADQTSYMTNVWARQKGAVWKHLIGGFMAPAVGAAASNDIIEMLNNSEAFQEAMCACIEEAAKHRCDK